MAGRHSSTLRHPPSRLPAHEICGNLEGTIDLSKSPMFVQQDQLVLSWLFMAIVPFILPQIAACTTSAGQNIQIPRAYNGNSFIFSGNGSPMKNSYSGNSTFSFDSCDFLLNNILLVVGTICKFCVNNNIFVPSPLISQFTSFVLTIIHLLNIILRESWSGIVQPMQCTNYPFK